MAYTTRSDLVHHFGEREIADLLDRDNNGVEDTGVLNHVIADSAAIIDGYLASRYSVPLDPVPQLIESICCDIVRYKLWDDRAPEEVRKRYEDRIKQLRDLANGVMSLPSTTTTAESGGSVDYAANERIFTMDSLADF